MVLVSQRDQFSLFGSLQTDPQPLPLSQPGRDENGPCQVTLSLGSDQHRWEPRNHTQHKRRVSLVCPAMSVKNRLLGSRQPAAEVSGATGWINTPLERVPAEGRGLRAQGRDQITRLGHCWALALPPTDFVGEETVGTNLTAARCGGCSRPLRLPRLSPTRVPGSVSFARLLSHFFPRRFPGRNAPQPLAAPPLTAGLLISGTGPAGVRRQGTRVPSLPHVTGLGENDFSDESFESCSFSLSE